MNKIQLLYVANEISKVRGVLRQELSFFISIHNLAFSKKVEIVWAGDDGIWHTLAAMYHSGAEQNREYWNATVAFQQSSGGSLPGDIQFAVRYLVSGMEYWDNNHHQNYHCRRNICLQQADHHAQLNIGYSNCLWDEQKLVPITVAVNCPLHAHRVSVHWTTDDWKHTNITRCYLKSSLALERDGHTTPDGVQLWKTLLNIGQDFRLQYSICCEAEHQVLWDNNHELNYATSRKPLNILILNLHCYQEENQDYKLSQIARAIDELCVDIVCLQEVAEPWNDGRGDWELNSARIINDRLAAPYHMHTDWSHLGFDRYREGVAILSRCPITQYDARYVSNDDDPFNMHARKVIMAQVDVPGIGHINCYSAHVSWWDDGFSEQFENLRRWADDKHNWQARATLLCGDFNIKAGSRGYEQVVNTNSYEDQFLAVTSPGVFKKIFRERRPHWQRYLSDDHRIDYVFMKKTSKLKITSARVVFTEQEYGRVSDHEGYLMTFEPK